MSYNNVLKLQKRKGRRNPDKYFLDLQILQATILFYLQYVEGQLGKTILKQSLAQLKEMDAEMEEEEFPPLGTQRRRFTNR